jgi:hypothetical protein
MELKKFNCLVKVYYKDGYISWNGLLIQARDEAEAEADIVDLLQSWENTEGYELEKIATNEYFKVTTFIVSARIQYKTQQRTAQFKVKAPSAETALATAREVVGNWKGIVNFQIDNVYATDRK